MPTSAQPSLPSGPRRLFRALFRTGFPLGPSAGLLPRRRSGQTLLALVLYSVLGPGLLVGLLGGCSSLNADKRILQQAIQKGIGRRYTGRSIDENYVLIGDRVGFEDLFNPGLRGAASVGIDGTIEVPEAGPVHVAGLTKNEIETLLTQKLSAFYVDTDVRVQIATGPGRVYYVLGQVPNPGPRPFQGDISLFDAVLAANPTEHSANLSRVRLIRADPVDPLIATLDVSALWFEGDSTDNWPLEEFDIIYVPPTVMQEVADWLSSILVPFTSIFRSVFQILFQVRGARFGNQNNIGIF